MGKFNAYSIALRNFSEAVQEYNYELKKDFFDKIDSPEVRDGDIDANVTIRKKAEAFEFQFVLTGTVNIPCDRCLDIMQLPIKVKDSLIVRLGSDYKEAGDNTIVIPESESEINIAWFLYEFIALAVPIKHVHESGKCNKNMLDYLKKCSPKQFEDLGVELDDYSEDVEEKTTDPRWDGLKDIIENN